MTPSRVLRLVPRASGADVDDATLVASAVDGEPSARELLFRRHVDLVSRVISRLIGRQDDVEDLVHDTFATAFAELPQLRDGHALRAWLMRIAIRAVYQRTRRRRLARMFGLDHGTDQASLERLAGHEVSQEVKAELALLDRVLWSLPIDERVAWTLRHVEGEPLELVARAMDVSLATAKRKIKAADDRVRRHVNVEVLDA